MKCTKCNEEKPEYEFYLNSRSKGGRRQPCKKCTNKQVMARRTKKKNQFRRYYPFDNG